MLEAENLVKQFEKNEKKHKKVLFSAVDHVSLHIKEGEIVGDQTADWLSVGQYEAVWQTFHAGAADDCREHLRIAGECDSGAD